jgi:hypothetical protein
MSAYDRTTIQVTADDQLPLAVSLACYGAPLQRPPFWDFQHYRHYRLAEMHFALAGLTRPDRQDRWERGFLHGARQHSAALVNEAEAPLQLHDQRGGNDMIPIPFGRCPIGEQADHDRAVLRCLVRFPCPSCGLTIRAFIQWTSPAFHSCLSPSCSLLKNLRHLAVCTVAHTSTSKGKKRLRKLSSGSGVCHSSEFHREMIMGALPWDALPSNHPNAVCQPG